MGSLSLMAPALATASPTLARPAKTTDPFYTSPQWRQFCRLVKAERGNKCEQCGVKAGPRVKIHVDHIRAIKQGGARLSRRNVQLLCTGHHNAKTAAEGAER